MKVRIKKTAIRRHWENLQEIISPDRHAGEEGTLLNELDSEIPSGVILFENGDEDIYPLSELEGRDK